MAKPFNVRMEPDLRDLIEQRVIAGEASNASEWAREAMAGVIELGGLANLKNALELVGRREELSPHPPRALQLRARPLGSVRPSCTHPVESLQQMPYHQRCGLCGATVR